jgi:hypothetical protein
MTRYVIGSIERENGTSANGHAVLEVPFRYPGFAV